ncbi:unnamed protein product [Mytilus edulis]|uniref:SOCS box domain-containing protein n=1 Tax=Mytilus edulis TaxID=6550 RepID=A0A8S3SDZ6_MYTED|nr:unnamed protein product [Mytilus edulis]
MQRKRKFHDNDSYKEKQEDEDKLKRAVKDGDETAVRRLVKGGVLAIRQQKLWFGGTILHDAVAGGKLPIIKLLLQAKADVNAKTKDNRTCLHVASRMGHTGNTDIVKELLNYGAEVNVQTLDRRTALHFATWRGNTDIVQELVNHGANVNLQDEDLWAPLYWAAKLNYIQIARILVENGADLNCANAMEQCPLHEVLKNGHTELAKYLISEGAMVTGKIKGVFQCMIDNKDIKTEDRISLCDIFIEAGYPIHSNSSLPQILSRKPYIDQNFVKHVQTRQLETLTLKSMCRICVRKELIKKTNGCSIRAKLPQLPLPKLLQNYIIL